MEEIDVIFAQNWIEQAYIAHLDHPNATSGSVMDICRRYGMGSITMLSVWRYTREGQDVWSDRSFAYCDCELWR